MPNGAATPQEIQDVFNILGLSKILRFAENQADAVRRLTESKV